MDRELARNRCRGHAAGLRRADPQSARYRISVCDSGSFDHQRGAHRSLGGAGGGSNDRHDQTAPCRVREFTAGRNCARAALRIMGHPATPIPARPDRLSSWPAGVCGSISHDADYCAVAVAQARHLRSIGIDVEQNRALEVALQDHVCSAEERQCWPR
ncbi:4'-phosphopantetheinyl transferase family protein [Rhodopseudomonas palustris]|uniref:4'-phosphopantetheinyl transferase family protein n=1 Tax=Rhodopseudomonas palustris TaxID=1076 RepID=UPI001AD82C7F